MLPRIDTQRTRAIKILARPGAPVPLDAAGCHRRYRRVPGSAPPGKNWIHLRGSRSELRRRTSRGRIELGAHGLGRQAFLQPIYMAAIILLGITVGPLRTLSAERRGHINRRLLELLSRRDAVYQPQKAYSLHPQSSTVFENSILRGNYSRGGRGLGYPSLTSFPGIAHHKPWRRPRELVLSDSSHEAKQEENGR